MMYYKYVIYHPNSPQALGIFLPSKSPEIRRFPEAVHRLWTAVSPATKCRVAVLSACRLRRSGRHAFWFNGHMVNPVHLRTLLEVTRRGSFAAAALQLGYTASAVSQQMSALEREAGVKLFERSARSVQLTEAAIVMSRHAAKVLTDIDALLAATASTHESTNEELRVGIFPSLATHALPRLLRTRAWRDLGLNLKISVAEPAQTIQGLRSGGDLDVALVYQAGQGGLAWPHTVTGRGLGDKISGVGLRPWGGTPWGWEFSAPQRGEIPWI